MMRTVILFGALVGVLAFAPLVVRAEPSLGDIRPAARPSIGVAPQTSLRPQARTLVDLSARWDHLPNAARWNRAGLRALRSHASVLPDIVPGDIASWCPAYPQSGRNGREAFWVGMLSTLAKHESTFRPAAVGGGGKWYGLLQILPATARGYGCNARSGAALKDGSANISCALRIMAVTVPRDQVISRNMRGIAADWGPFHSRRKRNDMIAWMRDQPYCKGLRRSLRPVARPSARPPLRSAARPDE